MNTHISPTPIEMGQAAASEGANVLRQVLQNQETANIILATGASQFEMLEALTKEPGIAWDRITGFRLDEYIGMDLSHPASFRGYLKKRFVDLVPIRMFHYVNAETDPAGECQRLGEMIQANPIDVAFIGIGENGHLAFNDPPADFEIEDSYIVVELDEACRKQQLGEGWFEMLDDVPTGAISMSIKQIMKSKKIVCTVPDERKAEAVKNALEGAITPDVPASILKQHPDVSLFLDEGAAAKLST